MAGLSRVVRRARARMVAGAAAVIVATAGAGLMGTPRRSEAQTLRGSHSSVDLMYTSARSLDLAFLQTSADIYEAAGLGELELLPITRDMTLDHVRYPFVLPNTHRFVDSLARAYHAACGERMVVTSGARPIDEQPRNASPLSVHPTGMAVDVRKPRGACLVWLRGTLLVLEARHVVEATEEHHPPHFHIAVLAQQPERRIAQVLARREPAGGRAQVAAGEVAGPGSAAGNAGGLYRVRAGDNLWGIARRHHTTLEAIKKLNGLMTNRLRVGQRLKLP